MLRARVRDDGDLGQVQVWAVVYPPSFEEPEPSPDGILPDLDLPKLVLSDTDGDGEYVGLYEGFSEMGTYWVVVYAEDAEEHLAQPSVLEVRRARTTYLPLVLRRY